MSNFVRVVALLAFAAGSAYVANGIIRFVAEKGFFEESTQEKFAQQSSGKLGVLFGGRPETLVAIQAIRDSPIIGHGSFAADDGTSKWSSCFMYENGYSDSDLSKSLNILQ